MLTLIPTSTVSKKFRLLAELTLWIVSYKFSDFFDQGCVSHGSSGPKSNFMLMYNLNITIKTANIFIFKGGCPLHRKVTSVNRIPWYCWQNTSTETFKCNSLIWLSKSFLESLFTKIFERVCTKSKIYFFFQK